MIWKDIRYDIIHMIIISKCSSKNARVALEWPLSHFDWVPRWECHTPTFIWPEHVVHVFVKRNSVQSNVTQCIAKARNTDHCNKIQSHPMTILKCEVFTSNPNALKQSNFSGMDVTMTISPASSSKTFDGSSKVLSMIPLHLSIILDLHASVPIQPMLCQALT